MSCIRALVRPVLGVLLGAAFISASAQAVTLKELASGPPAHQIPATLAPEAYVHFEADVLKEADVLWVNVRLARKLGIHFTDIADLKRQILREFAVIVPQNDAERAMVTGEKVPMEADLYGGGGLFENARGSGRAGIRGLFQVKGVRTPISPAQMNGVDTAEGAFKDAFWGEYLSDHLPYGAIKTLAVISPRLKMEVARGKVARGIAVRLNLIRPAHFVLPGNGWYTAQANKPAVQANLKKLAEALGGATLEEGFIRMCTRVADQLAAMYVQRIFHGAASTSNQAVDGPMVDFGTTTKARDFSTGYVLPHVATSGDSYVYYSYEQIVSELLKSIRENLGKDAITETDKAFWESPWLAFEARYKRSVADGFVAKMGFPESVLEKLREKAAAELAELGSIFHEIAETQSGPGSVDLKEAVPRKLAAYDIDGIIGESAGLLFKASRLYGAPAASKLAPELRNRLVTALGKLGEKAGPIVDLLFQNRSRFTDRIARKSALYSKQQPELSIASLLNRFTELAELADPSEAQSKMDELIVSSRNRIKGLLKSTLVCEHELDSGKN